MNEEISSTPPPTPRSASVVARQSPQFADLRAAGRQLASALEKFNAHEDAIVLGLALGGLPVAFEVAQALCLPLDFIILRRLLVPRGPDFPICAVNLAGTLVINEELPPRPATPESGLDYFLADALTKLEERTILCRGGRPAMELRHKTILLVDCGICRGGTMRAAIRALRTLQPAQIIAATPVASLDGRAAGAAIADQLITLASPEPFGHVGLWYRDFSRPGDQQVSAFLN